MIATVCVICYKYRTLDNGENPLMLRVTKDRKRKYLSIGISVNPKHWDFDKNQPKRNCPNKELIENIISEKTTEYRKQILEFKADEKDFSIQRLVEQVDKPLRKVTVEGYLTEIVNSLIAERRIGNSMHYKSLLNSLKKFTLTLQIPFPDINIPFLNKYESYLRSNGNSENTIGIKFRTLRATYNKAIKDNIVRKDCYPFDEFRVSRLKEETSKRAITKDEIKKLLDFDVSSITSYHCPLLKLSLDVFLFSYLGCGINLIDMANLKKENWINDRIFYRRHKTGKMINFQLQEQAIKILLKYKSSGNEYLLPLFDQNIHITPMQKHFRIKKLTKGINKNLKKIGIALGINIPLTTYVARHTYATVLKRSGVNTSIISESLGHSSEKITQIYLDSFENSQIDEAMKNLL